MWVWVWALNLLISLPVYQFLSDICLLAGSLYLSFAGTKRKVPKEKSPLWEISGKTFKHAEKSEVSVFRRKAVKQKPDSDFSFRMFEGFLFRKFPKAERRFGIGFRV